MAELPLNASAIETEER